MTQNKKHKEMNEKKMEQLLNEADLIDLINDRLDAVSRDNRLTEDERDEFRNKAWGTI